MSEHGLTPDALKQRYAPDIIDKGKTFETHGVSIQAAKTFLETPEGTLYWQKLADAAPTALDSIIDERAIEQLRSGRDLPRMEIINEPLVKAVPRGTQPTPYTPFFGKESDFVDEVATSQRINDRFGLPIASESPVYDLYRIHPKAPTEVFVSTVAPTSELYGQVTRAGGATQYLVPNRTLFTDAVRVTSIGNDLALHHDLVVGKGLGAPIAAAEAATRSLRPGLGAAVKGLGALGVLATTYDAVSTGERIETLLAQDNLLGAKHEARDFAVNNANAWAAAYAVGTLGAELGGQRRGVQGAIAGGIAGGIVGYVLSDKAMAGLDAREIANQTDAQGRPWTFNGRQWVKPMQADLHDDGVNRTHAQAFSADFDTRRELDYKAAHTVVTIALRRLPPCNPYRRIGLTPDAALTAMEICP